VSTHLQLIITITIIIITVLLLQERREIHTAFFLENIKERVSCKDLGGEASVRLK
jgi:preprotein translocase subunit SecG